MLIFSSFTKLCRICSTNYNVLWVSVFFSIIFVKNYTYFIFRQRGRKGEREGEKHQSVVSSCTPPHWDLAQIPGMCWYWESNQWPCGSQAGTQSTEPHQPGLRICLVHAYAFSIPGVAFFSWDLLSIPWGIALELLLLWSPHLGWNDHCVYLFITFCIFAFFFLVWILWTPWEQSSSYSCFEPQRLVQWFVPGRFHEHS